MVWPGDEVEEVHGSGGTCTCRELHCCHSHVSTVVRPSFHTP